VNAAGFDIKGNAPESVHPFFLFAQITLKPFATKTGI
jgi:hypothetical protein